MIISKLAITPNGKYVVNVANNNFVNVYNLATFELVQTILLEEEFVKIWGVAITPDGKNVIGASINNLYLWDLASGKMKKRLIEPGAGGHSLKLTRDGRFLVDSGSGTPTGWIIKIWDLNTGKVIHNLEGHRFIVLAVDITPDAKYVVSASEDKIIRIWSL